ncbi:MAG: hypothetical protein DWQ01_06685 [Planctomycetota bacterium]|nr:MAG: hypothetical protein DWQ01_06685 [Planctomycetota bacterium]
MHLARGSLVLLAEAQAEPFLAAFLASLQEGLCPICADGHSPEAELSRLAKQFRPSAVWTNTPGQESRWEAKSWPKPSHIVATPAVMKLSSGSSGEPKGIIVPIPALLADSDALSEVMLLGPRERALAKLPFSHSYGMSVLAIPALTLGMPLIVTDGHDPWAAGRKWQATFYPTVPAVLDAWLRLAKPPPLPTSLRLIVSAGAPLTEATAEAFRKRIGHSIHVFYGTSETGGICYDPSGEAGERGTLGCPIPGVRVTLEAVPGEDLQRVVVRGPAVAERYWPLQDPALQSGCFRSTDSGRWQDGELFLTGRFGDRINVGGKKVHPREIESVLSKLEAVDGVAVFGIPDPERGGERLRAVIACQKSKLDYATVSAWCRRHLAPHKVPRSILFVDSLPTTSRGKLDRKALQALEPS